MGVDGPSATLAQDLWKGLNTIEWMRPALMSVCGPGAPKQRGRIAIESQREGAESFPRLLPRPLPRKVPRHRPQPSRAQ